MRSAEPRKSGLLIEAIHLSGKRMLSLPRPADEKGAPMDITAEAMDIRSLEDLLEKKGGGTAFLEHEVKGLLTGLGIQVPRGIYLGGDEIAARPHPDVSSLRTLTYPLIAKVSSTKITSKSDVHGVRAAIKNETELSRALEELARIEQAEGVLVEEMAPQGVEVIVGGIVDKQFGPVVMFGLGGIFVELFKDVSFGLAPLSREDALRLLREVKGYRLLEGFRGSPPADIDALMTIIVKVSELMATGLLEEIDLNPVVVYSKDAMVLDAKMSVYAS
jgi:acyl-CoA synthetase (NDP forming)